MGISEGDIIKHDNALDVCLFITSVEKRLKIGTAVHGEWVNMAYVKSYFMNFTTKKHFPKNSIMIKPGQWKRLTNRREVQCFRYGHWESFDKV